MRFKTHLKASQALIDLTPLVDVIFLLLIFFIVTSDVLPLKSLHIENPLIDHHSSPLTSQLVVVVDAENVIYVGSKKAIVELSSLKEFLRSEIQSLQKQHPQATPTLVMSLDRRVEYGTFLRLFSIAQECCPRIRLVYQSSEPSPTEFY